MTYRKPCLLAFGASLAALAVAGCAAPAPTTAPVAHAVQHHQYHHEQMRSSYHEEMRRRHNLARDRARAGAEHVRQTQGQ